MANRLRRITDPWTAMKILETGRLITFSNNALNADSGANFLPIGGLKCQAADKGAEIRCLWFGPFQNAGPLPYAPNILHRAGTWRDVVPANSNSALLLLIGIKFEDYALDDYINPPWWAWAVKVPLLGNHLKSWLNDWRKQARIDHRRRVRSLLREKPRHIAVRYP